MKDHTLRYAAFEENAHLQFGKSDIPVGLYQDSAAYRAYLNLQQLPTNASAFNLDDTGYPTVHQGEYICRMMSFDQSLCGTKSAGKAHLLRHVDQDHGLEGKRSVPGSRRRTTGKREAASFYKVLMKDEEYEGKGVEEARVIEAGGEDKVQAETIIKQEAGASSIPQQTAEPEIYRRRKRALSDDEIPEAMAESEALELELKKTNLEIQKKELELRKIELQQRLLQKRKMV